MPFFQMFIQHMSPLPETFCHFRMLFRDPFMDFLSLNEKVNSTF